MANQLHDYFSHFGNSPEVSAYPPPPRCIGIIALEGNREVIYGLQSLAGKILSYKDLRSFAPLRILAAGSHARQTPQLAGKILSLLGL